MKNTNSVLVSVMMFLFAFQALAQEVVPVTTTSPNITYPAAYNRSGIITWAKHNWTSVQASLQDNMEFNTATTQTIYNDGTSDPMATAEQDVSALQYEFVAIRKGLEPNGFYLYFNNPLGGLLFQGGNRGVPVQQEDGTWALPAEVKNVQVRLSPQFRVPVKVEGVLNYAVVKVRHENSDQVDYSRLEVGDTNGVQWVTFSEELLSKGGDLQLGSYTYDDVNGYRWQTISYDLRDNSKLGTLVRVNNPTVTIAGTQVLGNNQTDWRESVWTNGTNIGEGSAFSCTLTRDSIVVIGAQNDVGDCATKVVIQRVDVPSSPETMSLPGGGFGKIIRTTGKYEWFYIYETMEGPGQDISPTYFQDNGQPLG